MTVLEFTLLVFAGALLAGFFGSLTGLGGGVIVIPLLTIVFKVDIRYAIGATLISVIATSSGAAAAYVKEGFTNIRIGIFLEMATSTGAIIGASIATRIPTGALTLLFGFMLVHMAYSSLHPPKPKPWGAKPDRLTARLHMDGTYPSSEGPKSYEVHNVAGGFSIMGLAGLLSGLLGVGSGALKVLAMDQAMRVPFKVSTTTSNFMIGVTAATGSGIYLSRGYVDPGLAMPVMLGVLIGSVTGARILPELRSSLLRKIFSAVVLVLAIEMIYKGIVKVV